MTQFEYLVCTVQMMYVTFVNGEWQGKLPPKASGALDTCPQLWDFLQAVGAEGWELITVNTTQGDELSTLYLKRETIT